MKVDLKFPLKPFVSPAAKDLISQVSCYCLNFFPYLDDYHKMVVFRFRWPEPLPVLTKIFCADACKEFRTPAPTPQSPRAPVDCPECRPLRRVQRLEHPPADRCCTSSTLLRRFEGIATPSNGFSPAIRASVILLPTPSSRHLVAPCSSAEIPSDVD